VIILSLQYDLCAQLTSDSSFKPGLNIQLGQSSFYDKMPRILDLNFFFEYFGFSTTPKQNIGYPSHSRSLTIPPPFSLPKLTEEDQKNKDFVAIRSKIWNFITVSICPIISCILLIKMLICFLIMVIHLSSSSLSHSTWKLVEN
jgi:hypothetical protein